MAMAQFALVPVKKFIDFINKLKNNEKTSTLFLPFWPLLIIQSKFGNHQIIQQL
jgi:hypothetical protein